ncbi:MAG TPA: CocE/NonD family hydrolase [Gaiellales bacterium]|nr:CocE/NonD family hydrolase [Gaiellales bacterium]
MTGAAVRSDFPRAVAVREGLFVPLADGTRLAARVWLPEDADSDPVPAVLEYLPYRLNDGTLAGDHQQMTWFAGHGYAGVRVDIRGTGESDGICTDEYTDQEQRDCMEVIDWIARQPWCTGAVGMMGYSWGGFNCLQVAARRPPALRAVASCYASDDRYADDVHYRGGLVIPMDMVHWSTCMLGWQARPPDPLVVGDRWREIWMQRLGQPPWIEHWLAHQRRDAYWRQGSVCDDPSRIDCPVMCVAGWTDGYRDSALRLMETLSVPRRALIGPWGHNDPVEGAPGPAVGVLGELVRWWDRWLKGVDNGVDREPVVVAWMQGSVPPSAGLEHRPGRWVAEQEWPSPRVGPRTFALADGVLTEAPGPATGKLAVRPVQTVGLDGGAWCADARSADLPVDQRCDDARSLTFTSEPLGAPLEILGFAQARLVLRVDRPWAMVSARLCEIRPDGGSLLVTRGQLNLCHRDSHADPRPVPVGDRFEATVTMDSIAHRFDPGSRIRLAVSPCYWPLAWPSPEPAALELEFGSGAELVLPERAAATADGPPRPPDPPEQPPPLELEQLHAGSGGGRRITRDLGTGAVELEFDWDCGGMVRAPGGMLYEDTSIARYSIVEDDPLSARVEVVNTSVSGRGDWRVDIRSSGVMTATASEFLVSSRLEVLEGGAPVAAHAWEHRFPRDHG